MNNDNLLKTLISVGKIKKVKRSGWLLKGIQNPESVADHTYRMAVFAMLIGKDLGVDTNKLIKMALVHDIAEGVVGDIVWESGKEVLQDPQKKHKLEKEQMFKIFADNLELYRLWEEYEFLETHEAKVLKLIDKLEILIQAGEYEKAHENTSSLSEFFENVDKYLKDSELANLYREIKTYFGH